jgi:hypothetical protein
MRARAAAASAVAACLLVGLLPSCAAGPQNVLPACSPNGPLACSTIDGFPVGAEVRDCAAQPDPCGDNERLARDGLDARDGHSSGIVHASMYAPDMARVCGPILCALSGGYSIFVFDLADGSRHAIAVSCPGIDACRAVPSYTPGSAG